MTVLNIGLPSEVKQADEVCTNDCVTEQTAIMRTRVIKVVRSPAERDPKIILAAVGAKIYRITAAGADTASVIKRDLYAFLFAAGIFPLSARGDICGTLEAASPYVTDTGRFIIVTAQPEYMP